MVQVVQRLVGDPLAAAMAGDPDSRDVSLVVEDRGAVLIDNERR